MMPGRQAAKRMLERSIGVHLRRSRTRLNMSGADLAATAGISTSKLYRIESGRVSPSLATLQSLAKALNQPFTSFFRDFEEDHDCSFVRAGRGIRVKRGNARTNYRYQLLGKSPGTGVIAEPCLVKLSRKALPYTAFRHQGIEFVYVLTGRLLYRHGHTTYQLEAGDALMFNGAVQHGSEELNELPASYLSIAVYRVSGTSQPKIGNVTVLHPRGCRRFAGIDRKRRSDTPDDGGKCD